jgi:hypothetical protein
MSQVLSGYQRKPGWIGILDKAGETPGTSSRPAGKSRDGGFALPLVGVALPLVGGSDTVPP